MRSSSTDEEGGASHDGHLQAEPMQLRHRSSLLVTQEVLDSQKTSLLKGIEETQAKATWTHALGLDPLFQVLKTSLTQMDDEMRTRADRALIANLRAVMKQIGGSVLQSMHDSAMPKFVHKMIDKTFVRAWPEIEKHVLDDIVMSMGFKFQKMRGRDGESVPPPKNPFLWMRAMILYSRQPFDLSFFAMYRDPLITFLQILFLIPYHGSDSILVIILWFCTYKYDAYQCAALIISAKKLAFITTGIISGLLGFVKLYLCTVQVGTPGWETSPGRCEKAAPGTGSTYEFEFLLFVIRTFLTWLTWGYLYWHKPLLQQRSQRLAYERRLDAAVHGAKNSGKLSETRVGVTLMLSALSTLAAIILFAFDPIAKRNQDTFNEEELASSLSNALRRFDAVSWGGGIQIIVLLCSQICVLIWVPYRAYEYRSTFLAGLFCACGFGAFAYALAPSAIAFIRDATAWGGTHEKRDEDLEEVLLNLAGALQTFLASTALIDLGFAQRAARIQDDKDREVLLEMLQEFDTDGDGTVSKKEFKLHFKRLMPKGNPDTTWRKIDKDRSGTLSLKELCVGLGFPHLVAEDDEQGLADQVAKELNVNEALDATRKVVFPDMEKSTQAGGVMLQFFWLDFGAIVITTGFLLYELNSLGIERGQWQFGVSLYFMKVLIALLSFPFLIFAIPTVKDWLISERITAYNQAGECVPRLLDKEIYRRFENARAEKRLLAAQGRGQENVGQAWDDLMGDYADSDDEEELDENGKPKQLTDAEKLLKQSKRAAKKKKRQQMRKFLPEASLLDVRRDRQWLKMSATDSLGLL